MVKQRSVLNSFLARGGMWPLPCSMLRFHLPWPCAGLLLAAPVSASPRVHQPCSVCRAVSVKPSTTSGAYHRSVLSSHRSLRPEDTSVTQMSRLWMSTPKSFFTLFFYASPYCFFISLSPLVTFSCVFLN